MSSGESSPSPTSSPLLRGTDAELLDTLINTSSASARRGSSSGSLLHFDNVKHYTPNSSARRLNAATPASLTNSVANRVAPTMNACRCINEMFQFTADPPLNDGELKAVEGLFGNADGNATHAIALAASPHLAIFPDGYFVGRRLLFQTKQQEYLTSRRPHPLQNQYTIKRCLNCHMDVYAHSEAHELVVINARSYFGPEISKWRETDLFSKHFNILIRNNNAATAFNVGTLATSPHSGNSDMPLSASTPTSQQSSPALFQLKSTLDQCLEAERISMETRLSQLRAVEEQKYAEVEHKIRREYGMIFSNVEREMESGPNPHQPPHSHFLPEGVSPRAQYDPYARRNSTPRLQRLFGSRGSADAAAAAADAAETDPSTSIPAETSMSPTRVVDILQQSSRGISPSTSTGPGSLGGPPTSNLSRTSSRGSGNTPPLGTSSDDRASAAAAAAAEHKSAVSVVAVPLDLHRDSPTAPAISSGRTSSAPSSAIKMPISKHLPAPPVLSNSAAAANTATTVSAPADRMEALELDEGGIAAVPTETKDNGIALVPFTNDTTSNSLLLQSLSNFDDFVLPTSSASTQGASAADDAIFDLDEDQSRKAEQAEAAVGLSPQLRAQTLDDSAMEDELDEEDALEDEELSDEELAAPVISSKAAKLLGMGGGLGNAGNASATGASNANNANANSSAAGAFPSSVIRPRTSSGNSGVTMVPMSLPIAIPAQLKQMVNDKNGAKEPPPQGTPSRPGAESGLSRSLKAAAAQAAQGGAGKPAVPHAAPRLAAYSSSSDDEEDHSSASGQGDEGGFVPPHTLVDEPFFSFAKVQHLGSFKEKARPVATGSVGMRVQHFTPESNAPPGGTGGGSSSTSPTGASASPFTSNNFTIPMSSSVPRVIGGIGAGRIVGGTPAATTVTAAAAGPQPKLGFVATNQPAPKAAPNPARGAMPSSRNPNQK